MKKAKFFLIVFISLFFIPSVGTAENERNIYIGDLIELKITSQTITEDELREKFKEFDIVDIKNDGENYIITIRSFEPGEKLVKIGNKEIVIDIKSTLDEIENESIFEGSLEPKEGNKFNITRYAAFIFPSVFLVSGIGLLIISIQRKKAASLTPYQLFIKNVKGVSLNDTMYLVKLTESFKKYIEDVYSYSIRGKTSSEIIGEIKNIKEVNPILKNLEEWLYECDIFKFSGKTPSHEDKKRLLESLIDIVGKIEKTKEGEI
jgi:hypothetical protein